MATGISVARCTIVNILAKSLEGFVYSSDILVRFDDGIKMRAQWQVIARHSKICTDVLDGGPLSCASGSEKVNVPLEGHSKEEASTFLSVPYSVDPASSIDESTGLSTARLDQVWHESVLLPIQRGRAHDFKFKSACLVPYSQILYRSYDMGTAPFTGLSKMQGRFAYLAEGPEGLVNSCDILLKLDDGTRLPAHSPVLARFSPVFAGMLDEGPLSGALERAGSMCR